MLLMLLMLLLPVGEDENSSSVLGGRVVASGNLAANGCNSCNGLGGAESCSSLRIIVSKGSRTRVDYWRGWRL
jgi:hypothetical protein